MILDKVEQVAWQLPLVPLHSECVLLRPEPSYCQEIMVLSSDREGSLPWMDVMDQLHGLNPELQGTVAAVASDHTSAPGCGAQS